MITPSPVYPQTHDSIAPISGIASSRCIRTGFAPSMNLTNRRSAISLIFAVGMVTVVNVPILDRISTPRSLSCFISSSVGSYSVMIAPPIIDGSAIRSRRLIGSLAGFTFFAILLATPSGRIFPFVVITASASRDVAITLSTGSTAITPYSIAYRRCPEIFGFPASATAGMVMNRDAMISTIMVISVILFFISVPLLIHWTYTTSNHISR